MLISRPCRDLLHILTQLAVRVIAESLQGGASSDAGGVDLVTRIGIAPCCCFAPAKAATAGLAGDRDHRPHSYLFLS